MSPLLKPDKVVFNFRVESASEHKKLLRFLVTFNLFFKQEIMPSVGTYQHCKIR